jgi:HEAT repeat protein
VEKAVERFVLSSSDVSAWATEVARSEPEVQIAARAVADHSGSIAERTRAVAKLGGYQHPVVIQALVKTALTDPSAQVRTVTIAPLLRRGSPDAIDTVKRLAVSDEDEDVRLEAMLGLFHDTASVDRKQLLESVLQTAQPAGALREIAGDLLQKLST